MRAQSVVGATAKLHKSSSMIAVAVTVAIVLGFCWQTAYAQNPAGFLGGAYAFAGETGNKFLVNRNANNISFNGHGVGGTALLTSIPIVSSGEAVPEQTRTLNALYADQGIWRFYAICTKFIGNVCLQWSFSQSFYYPLGSSAEAVTPTFQAVLDFISNGSGSYSAFKLSGIAVPAPTTFNLVKTNIGGTEYFTIPWTPGNTAALGIKGGFPQVHIPSSNGVVAFDFDGNGIADPDLMISPALTGTLATAEVPTLGEWGMILLTLLLMFGGVWMLRRSQVRISLS